MCFYRLGYNSQKFENADPYFRDLCLKEFEYSCKEENLEKHPINLYFCDKVSDERLKRFLKKVSGETFRLNMFWNSHIYYTVTIHYTAHIKINTIYTSTLSLNHFDSGRCVDPWFQLFTRVLSLRSGMTATVLSLSRPGFEITTKFLSCDRARQKIVRDRNRIRQKSCMSWVLIRKCFD